MNNKEKTKVTAIKGGMLIDGTGDKATAGNNVIIEGSTIKALGSNIPIPQNADVIDAKGRTVMPGLIDSHVHFWGGLGGGPEEKIARPAELALIKSISDARDLLAAGYTTAKDCGSRNALFLKKATAEGTLTGLPRIVAAGYWLSQTYGHFDTHYFPPEYVDIRTTKLNTAGMKDNLICDGVDECIKATRYALREGADFIKCSTTGGGGSDRDTPADVQFNLDEIKAIVETAAQVGKYVSAHCEMSLIALKQSIVGGIKTIDHACLTNDECIDLAMKNDVIFVSTLTVFKRIVEAGEEMGTAAVESYKRIHRAGATLAAGTDTAGSMLKFGKNASELELLVNICDFSPMDAIVAATKNGAKACYMGNKTGTIEPGKLADIIIIDGNPLEDIKILQNQEKIKMVMLEGEVEISR